MTLVRLWLVWPVIDRVRHSIAMYGQRLLFFLTKACARRPDAAASVERRRRERRTLLAGAAGELAGATRLRQVRPSSACTFSGNLLKQQYTQ
jgi:hypothetical protein